MDVSEWDVEATFAAGAEDVLPKSATANGKRKKNELEQGEVWRAKNVSTVVALGDDSDGRCRTTRSRSGRQTTTSA